MEMLNRIQQDYPPGEPGKDYTPVITPNGSTLPFKVIGGVKVFIASLKTLITNSPQAFALIAGASTWNVCVSLSDGRYDADRGDHTKRKIKYVIKKSSKNIGLESKQR
jgi:hypothetical protein